MSNYRNTKPLGIKSYGSIGHLPQSRMGPSDSSVHEGQARICTEKTRDKHDYIIVQEKLDGSNVGVALLDGELVPLTRAGYHARTSPYEQHHMFADWVRDNEERFRAVLTEGERICGEWLAQAHGTLYDLMGREPFVAFDLMNGTIRNTYYQFWSRVAPHFQSPTLLHVGGAISVDAAMKLHATRRFPCDEVEGVVYRVERKGKVDFLAKYVRPDKVDGKYLPSISGKEAIWNWRPTQ